MPPLLEQRLTRASNSQKIQGSILATAMVDALGGPAEFKERFSFPLLTSMIPNDNFDLPPGVWTDDTSMTLCLARSLASTPGFDQVHQLKIYASWLEQGTLSAIGRCFDIGGTTNRALEIYIKLRRKGMGDKALDKIKAELSGKNCAGNGSLMRVLPIGLAYWRDREMAREYARRSSATTHPNAICMEACEMWTGMIVRVMENSGAEPESIYTKLDVIEYIAHFPYTSTALQKALSCAGRTLDDSFIDERESYYWAHHPILQLIAKTQTSPPPPKSGFSKIIPAVKDLSSSGYVLHSMVAALYCFFATENFEEGAIMAVNLGDDADTVGAIYAGLAGCWYSGQEETDSAGVFWSSRVNKWRENLVERAMVQGVAMELVQLSEGLANKEA